MALDEATRHALHTRLEEVLGAEHAVAAMSAYPPAGEDLATRRDLEGLEERLSLRFESALNRGLNSQTKTLVFSSIGSMAAMLGGAAAISNLFG